MSSTIAKQDVLALLFEGTDPFATLDTMSEEDRTLANRELWQESIGHLIELRSLDDDWDGQGAKAPPVDLVDSAIVLAAWFRDEQITPPHYAIAGVNGTIHFEWVNQSRSFDIEVIAPGLAEICAVDLTRETPPLWTYRW